jgi:hypothetical protein
MSDSTISSEGGPRFGIKWMTITHAALLELLGAVRWHKDGSDISGELGFLHRSECPVTSWIILAPQLSEQGTRVWRIGPDLVLTCISRSRPSPSRFNVFSVPAHLEFARWLVGASTTSFESQGLKPVKATGILLLYPTLERIGKKILLGSPVMGFGLQLPDSPSASRVAFRVRNRAKPDEVVVPLKK